MSSGTSSSRFPDPLGDYRDVTVVWLMGLIFVAFAVYESFRLEPLLRQETMRSVYAQGALAGFFMAGLLLVLTGVALLGARRLWSWYDDR